MGGKDNCNGSEEQVYKGRNGGSGTARRAGKRDGGLERKINGKRARHVDPAGFTAFGSMAGIKQAVYDAAVRVYDSYTEKGLREQIPFFGVGIQYIRFAREEPALYRLLFLTQKQVPSYGAMDAMLHLQERVRPTLVQIYRITPEEADVYFRDLWLVVHSLATLIVTGDCPYSDREIGSILTGFSLSICKAIKEVPGFAAGTFDRDAVFRALVGK